MTLEEAMEKAGVLKDDLWRTIRLPQYRELPCNMVIGVIELLKSEFIDMIPLEEDSEEDEGEKWKNK